MKTHSLHIRQHTNDPEEHNATPAWLMSFSDLLSLVLTFFVLLYAMSSVDEIRWNEVSLSLSQKLNPDRKVDHTVPAEEIGITRIDLPDAFGLDYLLTIITDKFGDSQRLKSAFTIERLDDRLVISLIGDTFQKGHTTLTQNGYQTVAILGDVLQTIGNHIDIYGNASPEPINTAEFPSNWELSLSRSLVVSQVLRNRGYAYKITAFGRAESTYSELEHLSGEERGILSRRVDIVIRDYRAKR